MYRLLRARLRDLDVGPGNLIVHVANQDPSAASGINIAQFRPAIFTSFGGPIFKAGMFQEVAADAPAFEGDVLQMFVSGLGVPAGDLPGLGQAPSGILQVAGTVRVFLKPEPQEPTLAFDNRPAAEAGEYEASILFAGLSPGVPNVFQVNFDVPSIPCEASATRYLVVLEVSDPDTGASARSSPIPLGVGISLTRVENGASYVPGSVSPGAIVSVFGKNFMTADNLQAFPATDQDGLSFSMNGEPTHLLNVLSSSCQINLLVPNDFEDGGADGQIEILAQQGDQVSNALSVKLETSTPGIFPFFDPADDTRRFGIATLANTVWLALPDSVSVAAGLPVDCEANNISPAGYCGRPAHAGDVLTLWMTGLGQATDDGTSNGNLLPNDEAPPLDANPIYRTVGTPEVLFGDVPGRVSFSGLAPGFPGLYQVNVTVPEGVPPGDAVPLVIRMPDGGEEQALIAVAE